MPWECPKLLRASTCFGGHSNHALLLLPETDVIFKCQEIKQKLQKKRARQRAPHVTPTAALHRVTAGMHRPRVPRTQTNARRHRSPWPRVPSATPEPQGVGLHCGPHTRRDVCLMPSPGPARAPLEPRACTVCLRSTGLSADTDLLTKTSFTAQFWNAAAGALGRAAGGLPEPALQPTSSAPSQPDLKFSTVAVVGQLSPTRCETPCIKRNSTQRLVF